MRPAPRIPEISAPQHEYVPPPRPQTASLNRPAKPNIDAAAERELLVSARMTSLARPQLKPQNLMAANAAPTNLVTSHGVSRDGVGGPLIAVKPRDFASVEPTSPAPKSDDTVSTVTQPGDFTATNQFIWPVSGKVISSFGQNSHGLTNDGVNIAVDVGTPVKAADHGTVIYAGNQVPGFGDLLLVKHSNGFVTAYAHNSKLLVKKGAKVHQGQVIANSGQSGGVDKPQVHFEIRRGDRPVNPKQYIENANARL